jgi:hypothetical protein
VVNNVSKEPSGDDDDASSSHDSSAPILEPIEPQKQQPAQKSAQGGQQSSNNADTEAPIFELRQLEIEGGEPSTWADNALKVWEIYEKAIGDAVYRAGNHEEMDFYIEGYEENQRPLRKNAPKQAQDDAPAQNIVTTATSATNTPVPAANGGLKAKARSLFQAIADLF